MTVIALMLGIVVGYVTRCVIDNRRQSRRRRIARRLAILRDMYRSVRVN
jgi:uncharacterized membrane protein